MIPSISEVVVKFKREWTTHLKPETIQMLCLEAGLVWRKRVLPPARTVELFLVQVLHGNTAITYLPHLAREKFSPAAYCKARMRLPLRVFELLVERIQQSLHTEDLQSNTWLGHRVFIADGTGVSMPDVPELKEHFGYPHRQRKECSFPVAKLLCLMHLQTGMIMKVLIDHLFTHDISGAPKLHTEFQPNDIFVGDRAFCSYHHFCLLLQRGVHAVIRMHQKLVADFTPARPHVPPGDIPSDLGQPKSRWVCTLGKKDQVVEWFKPKSKPKHLTREQHQATPKSLPVREMQYHLSRNGFRTRTITVITTLLDANRYPAKKIAELYGFRWQIETNLNHLKTTMKMDILKSKTVAGIKKEILAFSIVYNLVRLVMLQAAKQQGVKLRSISFVDALRWLCTAEPQQKITLLILLPERPGRYEPRTKKRREKSYPYMISPRPELRKKKLSQILER